MRFNVGDIMLHNKGGYYRVLMYCKHSETKETMIVYESLKTKGIEARPLSMFDDNRFVVVIQAEDLKSQ